MGASESCPHCGAVRGNAVDQPLAALYQEVARIREIAEQRQQENAQETIASLTREVQMLRETVARLRGTTYRGIARPQQVRTPAGTSAA
jgi:hypothetical protein